MQLQFLALLLSAGSLALPTENSLNDTASGALTKRANYGWVAEYAADDWGCTKGEVDNFRPKIQNSCIPMQVEAGNYFGINWGTWPLGVSDSLIMYQDTNCVKKVGELNPLISNNSNIHGTNTCVMASWYGAPFGSVAAYGVGNEN